MTSSLTGQKRCPRYFLFAWRCAQMSPRLVHDIDESRSRVSGFALLIALELAPELLASTESSGTDEAARVPSSTEMRPSLLDSLVTHWGIPCVFQWTCSGTRGVVSCRVVMLCMMRGSLLTKAWVKGRGQRGIPGLFEDETGGPREANFISGRNTAPRPHKHRTENVY